jgi:hypothetical protein
VRTATEPSVAAEPKLRVIEKGELVLPIFTKPRLAAVCGLIDLTAKDCETGVAAAHDTPSPGWLAWILQFPFESKVAVEADESTVQTAGVVETKLIFNPELAVAFNATGAAALMTCVGIAVNEIVCVARVTVKLCGTLGAGA